MIAGRRRVRVDTEAAAIAAAAVEAEISVAHQDWEHRIWAALEGNEDGYQEGSD